MILREWKFEDVLKISELEKECFPKEPWSYKTLVSVFQSPAFVGVLAEDGGEIIGYGGITLAADSADVENIAVLENFRGAGVGSQILQKLLSEAKCRGAQNIFLEVRVSNAPAMKMYLKHGFIGVYARQRYYSDGEDCLVMRRVL